MTETQPRLVRPCQGQPEGPGQVEANRVYPTKIVSTSIENYLSKPSLVLHDRAASGVGFQLCQTSIYISVPSNAIYSNSDTINTTVELPVALSGLAAVGA